MTFGAALRTRSFWILLFCLSAYFFFFVGMNDAFVAAFRDAGMSRSETAQAVQLISRLAENKTMVIVEHDMGVVFDLAATISVLVYGEIIASGTPAEIRTDERVREAYLGTEAD